MLSILRTRPSWWRRWFGTRSERAAERYLRQQGFKILARNYRCPLGELDIVASEDRCIVFVEVRSTSREDLERTAASVDFAKQRRLTRLALHYLQTHNLLEMEARFDVLLLSWPETSTQPTIEHWRAAFESTDRFQQFS